MKSHRIPIDNYLCILYGFISSTNSYDHDVYYKKRVEPLHIKDSKSTKAIEKPKMKKCQLKTKPPTKAELKQSKAIDTTSTSTNLSQSSTCLNAATSTPLDTTGMAKERQNGSPGSVQVINNARKIPKTATTRQPIDNANVVLQSQGLQESTLLVDIRPAIEKIMKREEHRRTVSFYVFTQNGLWVQAEEEEPQQRLETLGEFLNFLDNNRPVNQLMRTDTPIKRIRRTQLKPNIRK